jgi:tryptophan synthase alpha chain
VTNLIDKAFLQKGLKIMTHIVAGYPGIADSKKLIRTMADNGADLIEVQIPFSDPMADGPTIMTASHKALQKGIGVNDCLKLIKEIKKDVNIPLLFMTYANIPFHYGIKKFIEMSADAGISGLIIPDIPYDEVFAGYLETAKNNDIHIIQLASPGMSEQRMDKVISISSGFIYATLKVGITGAKRNIDRNGLDLLQVLKKKTSVPVAAGFGISSPQQVKQLGGIVDAAIVGSHLIELYNKKGLRSVGDFIRKCKVG